MNRGSDQVWLTSVYGVSQIFYEQNRTTVYYPDINYPCLYQHNSGYMQYDFYDFK